MPKPTIELSPEILAELDAMTGPGKRASDGRMMYTDEQRALIVAARERGVSWRALAELFMDKYGFGTRSGLQGEYNRLKGESDV